MERFCCYLAGFAIALALAAVFLLVKSAVEDRMEEIAKDACEKYFRGVIQYVRDLTVDLIDSKLAEKEGEHDG